MSERRTLNTLDFADILSSYMLSPNRVAAEWPNPKEFQMQSWKIYEMISISAWLIVYSFSSCLKAYVSCQVASSLNLSPRNGLASITVEPIKNSKMPNHSLITSRLDVLGRRTSHSLKASTIQVPTAAKYSEQLGIVLISPSLITES